MSDDKKEVKAGDSEHVVLKLMGQDNAIVQFKMKKHAPLRKLMNAYCDRACLPMAAVLFEFDGHLINELDTPSSVEMQDGDTIKVYERPTTTTGLRLGIYKHRKHLYLQITMSDDKKEVKASDSKYIILNVMGQDNAFFKFKVKKYKPLRKLMNAYCDRVCFLRAAVQFEFHGYLINELDTPASLEMQEGDTIKVYQRQTGGLGAESGLSLDI